MFDSVSQTFHELERQWDNFWYIEPYKERLKEFEADARFFLSQNGGYRLEDLQPKERELLLSLGAALYSSHDIGFCEDYLEQCFHEEIGQYLPNGYSPPEKPVDFFKKSKLPDLKIFVATKSKFDDTKVIKLSEKFMKFLDEQQVIEAEGIETACET